jgi:hypothetical protein
MTLPPPPQPPLLPNPIHHCQYPRFTKANSKE